MAKDQTNFLLTLGLTTSQQCQEIKSRLKERRRRNGVSPHIFLLLDQEKQDENGEVKPEFRARKKKRGRPRKQKLLRKMVSPVDMTTTAALTDEVNQVSPTDHHDATCSSCQESGELLMCDTCTRVYHLTCVVPPLQDVPQGAWFCPVCKEKMQEARLPDVSEIIQSKELYTSYWHERDTERRQHESMAVDLRRHKQQLETRVKMLSDTIANHIVMKKDTMRNISLLQESISKMEQFIDVIKQIAHSPT